VVDSDKYGEVLIPAIQQCILDVNVEEQTMKVYLLEGLIS
jgi:16S rRNA processing protein RimM